MRSRYARVNSTIRVPFLWLITLAVLSACETLSRAENPLSHYEHDLSEVNRRLAEPSVEVAPRPPGTARAALLAEKAFLTEDAADLTRAREAVEALINPAEPFAPFVALHVKLLLQLHQTNQATKEVTWLETNAPLYPEVTGLRTDLLIESGEFTAARTLCETELKKRREWPMLARLAQVNTLVGRAREADALYQEAEGTLTVKQMRVLAWVEVQRGRLAASHGKWDEAEAHYLSAEQAYAGLWSVAAGRAEAAGAQGRYAEAIALYEKLAERTGRPELFQALGDLYRFSGNAEEAKTWQERALVGYRASADRGEVLYFHHLAEFYADVRGDGEVATTWARRDWELRPGPRTRQSLAWALYRKGAISDALKEINAALSSGLQTAHLFEQAARINAAAGRDDEAKRLWAKAASLNPHYEGFHAHF